MIANISGDQVENIDYINEAVYFFYRIMNEGNDSISLLFQLNDECLMNTNDTKKDDDVYILDLHKYKFLVPSINESIIIAVLRILVVNHLLDFERGLYQVTKSQIDKHQYILEHKISPKKYLDYSNLYRKATEDNDFFFSRLSELEYEIYSRCNYPITYHMGKEIINHINFENTKVIEFGGNSGGLGTAIVSKYDNCNYTIVDSKIPCVIGNEYKEINNVDIRFIEYDIFKLQLANEAYDYVLIMNVLHDYDDDKCLEMIQNAMTFSKLQSKFIIIEDFLYHDFAPKETIMHGLRLSIECRGGKQRTLEEVETLFRQINYKIGQAVKLNLYHTMVIMESVV